MANAVLVQRLIVSGAALVALFITTLLCLLVMAIGCAVGNAISRWRLARRYDYGPNANALWADLDAHLDDYVTADPELEAGFARLRAAVRDQQEGEQA